MDKEIKKFAKEYIKFYKFKNYPLDDESYGMLELTRKINKVVGLDVYKMWDLDDFLRKEISK